jgi:DNA polymerase
MRRVRLASEDDVEGWRAAARALDREGVAPEAAVWEVEGREAAADLFAAAGGHGDPKQAGNGASPGGAGGRAAEEAAAQERAADAGAPLPQRDGGAGAGAGTEPRGAAFPEAFEALTERMLLHRDTERFALAYRLLRRLRAEPALMRVASDPDLRRAEGMAASVRRDMHKMKAFVRFRAVEAPDGGEAFVAWFEPDHHILRATAPFFARRFSNMRWSILTPEASAHWDGDRLSFGAGASRADAPDGDRLEALWRTYYASIFNPARLKPKAMAAEMPRKYWRNLPEARLISPLIREAATRTRAMVEAGPTPPRAAPAWRREAPMADENIETLEALAKAEAACERCPLYKDATQVCPGEGPAEADLMFVGEQPGDQEDLQGRPFVGPAGHVFDVALERLQIDRKRVFVTNAVKHFKFTPRGKKRIHSKPSAGEIDHCRWWLDLERRIVKPKLIVALGATAVRGVTGRTEPVMRIRGEVRALPEGGHMMATVHPSYLLRIREEARKRPEWNAFLDDLGTARDWVRAQAA